MGHTMAWYLVQFSKEEMAGGAGALLRDVLSAAYGGRAAPSEPVLYRASLVTAAFTIRPEAAALCLDYLREHGAVEIAEPDVQSLVPVLLRPLP